MPNEALLKDLFKNATAKPPETEETETTLPGLPSVDELTTDTHPVQEAEAPPVQDAEAPKDAMPSSSELMDIGAQNYMMQGQGMMPSNPFGNVEIKNKFWGKVATSYNRHAEERTIGETAGMVGKGIGRATTGILEFFAPTRGLLDNWDWARDNLYGGVDRPFEMGFPGAQDFLQLFREVGRKLDNKMFGIEASAPLRYTWIPYEDDNFELPGKNEPAEEILPKFIEFIGTRWNIFDPEFPENFGKALAEDPVGMLEDISMLATVKGWGAAAGSKVSRQMSKGLRAANARIERRFNKVGIHTAKTAKALEQASDSLDRFQQFMLSSMSPKHWTMPGMEKIPGIVNKLGRFGSRWGITDVMDPGMAVPMVAVELIRSKTAKHYAAKMARFAEKHKVSGGVDIQMRATDYPRIDDPTIESSVAELGGVIGNPQILRSGAGGERWDSRYAILPIESVTPSHIGKQVNPRFVEMGGVQYKDVSTKEAQDFIDSIADPQKFDAEIWNEVTRSIVEGSPIVDMTGVVESGNARTLAMLKIISESPELFKQYQENLREILPQIGIDPDTMNAIEGGVLFRMRTSELTPEQRDTFIRAANEPVTRRLTTAEVSELDLDHLTPENLRKFTLTDARTLQDMLKQDANRDFVAAFVNELPQAERTAFLNNDQFKGQLIERVENALVRFAYPGEEGQRFTQDIIESTDEGLKNISNVAVAIAPKLIELRLLVQNNAKTPDFDVASDIADAVVTFNQMRRESAAGRATPVYDYLHRTDFIEQKTHSPVTQALMYHFERNMRKATDLRETIADFLDTAITGDMFRPQTAELLLKDVLQKDLKLKYDADVKATKSEAKREELKAAYEVDLGILNETIVDTDPVPTTEKAVDDIDKATDTLEQNAKVSEYGEKVGAALDSAGTEMELMATSAMTNAIAEMKKSGELSQGTLIQLNNFLNTLTPEVLSGFRNHLEQQGVDTAFMNKIPLRPLGEVRNQIDLFHRLTLDPRTEVYGQVGLGWQFSDMNRPNQAIERFTKAIERDPEDAYGYTGRANVLLRQGNTDAAMLDIDQAIALDSGNAYAYSQRGYAHKMQGDEASANRDFDRAERIMTRRWAQDAISEEAAVAKLQQSLTGSETAESMAYVAWKHWGDPQDPNRQQNLNRMVARAREAVKLDGGHIEGHGALAVGLYNLGKKAIFESNRDGLSEAQRSARRRSAQNYFTQANEIAEALLALDPNSSIGLNIKGWALTQMGREAEGRQSVDAAQQAEATTDAPDTPKNVSEIVTDAEESVQFLEDAKTKIEVERQPDGSFTVRHPYLDANGEPIESTGQYAVGSTEEGVRQTAIDMIDREIARYRETGEQVGDAPTELEVPDTDSLPPDPIADLNRRIQSLNSALQQTDGINRSQEIRRQIRELEQERDRLEQQGVGATDDDDIPFDAPDDEGSPPDTPPDDAETARPQDADVPSMPIEVVEEFYRYLQTNAKGNPEVASFADSLGALTADLVEQLSQTRPELKDLFEAYNNAEQIVANHARHNFIEYLTQKFGNAVDDVAEYQKLVDEVFDSTSVEDIAEIKKGLSEPDTERLEGAFWQRALDTWMRGGEGKIGEMLENGTLAEFVGPDRVNAINYFDDIITGYLDAKERGRSVRQPTAEDARRINTELEEIATNARQRAAEARAEEERIAQEIESVKEEMSGEIERTEDALESEENIAIAEQRMEEQVKLLETIQTATQAKARFAEAQAELALLERELRTRREQGALKAQERTTPDVGRQPNPMEESISQARNVGEQRTQELMSQKAAKLQETKEAIESRQQILDQMIQEQQTATADAGRQPNPMDDTLEQAGDIGRQRRADFIAQEQKALEEARAEIAQRERSFEEILSRQKSESQQAGQTAQTESQRQREAQTDISNQAQEVGKQRAAEDERRRAQEAEEETQAERARQQQQEEYETIEAKIERRRWARMGVIEGLRNDPNKFIRAMHNLKARIIHRGSWIAGGLGVGFYSGANIPLMLGAGAAAYGVASGLEMFAKAWRVEQILKQYDLHFSGTHGVKMAIDAYEAMMNEAIRKGTITAFRSQRLLQRSLLYGEGDATEDDGNNSIIFEPVY